MSSEVKRRVVLVGHCGFDSSGLMRAVESSIDDVVISQVNSDDELAKAALEADLLLVNRVLDGDFGQGSGVELIRELSASSARCRTMLISNYPEAQEEAESAGAAPGFGKKELGSDRVRELLRDAVGDVQ